MKMSFLLLLILASGQLSFSQIERSVKTDTKTVKQLNNSLKLYMANFSLRKFEYVSHNQLHGLGFERKVSNSFSAGLGYFQWRRTIGGRFKTEMGEYPYKSDTTRGHIIGRIGYAMMDLAAHYNYNIYEQKHILKLGTGISYVWGWNRCIGHRYYNPYHGWVGTDYLDLVSYWGIVPQISYDFIFLKNRLNLGLDVRGRFYVNVPNHQYDMGIHAGVNF